MNAADKKIERAWARARWIEDSMGAVCGRRHTALATEFRYYWINEEGGNELLWREAYARGREMFE